MREHFLGKIEVEVISVISADNKADGLPRLNLGCVNLPWALEIANGHFNGQRIFSECGHISRPINFSEPGKIRHPEGLDPHLETDALAVDKEDVVDMMIEEDLTTIIEGLEVSLAEDEVVRSEECWYTEGPNEPPES